MSRGSYLGGHTVASYLVLFVEQFHLVVCPSELRCCCCDLGVAHVHICAGSFLSSKVNCNFRLAQMKATICMYHGSNSSNTFHWSLFSATCLPCLVVVHLVRFCFYMDTQCGHDGELTTLYVRLLALRLTGLLTCLRTCNTLSSQRSRRPLLFSREGQSLSYVQVAAYTFA